MFVLDPCPCLHTALPTVSHSAFHFSLLRFNLKVMKWGSQNTSLESAAVLHSVCVRVYVCVCVCVRERCPPPSISEATGAAGVRLSSGEIKEGKKCSPVCRQMFTCVRQVSLSREDLCRARGGCLTPLFSDFFKSPAHFALRCIF